jgi:hypothetical protein
VAARWARRLFAAVAAALALPAVSAERDICENKAGAELIRCIEAAARSGPQEPGQPASNRAPSPGKPLPSTRQAPAVPATAELPRPAPEDCTGLTSSELRRCLAAGGRLPPDAAIAPPAPKQPLPAAAGASESCEGKSGEPLRKCIEAQATTLPRAAPRTTQPQLVSCIGYARADQPLCLHRNTAISACRNRSLYPDFDVCMRSHMASAPDPGRADCSTLKSRAREHCEARNRVYANCTGDKVGYFACLERQLGADAVLTRR